MNIKGMPIRDFAAVMEKTAKQLESIGYELFYTIENQFLIKCKANNKHAYLHSNWEDVMARTEMLMVEEVNNATNI